MGTLIFLLTITLVISLHEYGHYLACRIFGIPVTEFSVGLGTRLWSHHGNTEWVLRLIPMGGYIKPEPAAMDRASPWAKFVVAIAGPLANLLPLIAIAAWMGKLGGFFKLVGSVYVLSFKAVYSTLMLPFHAFSAEPVHDAVTGPVGILSNTNHVTHEMGGLVTALTLFLVLNLSVALFNLLPIPLLDGGRAVIAIVEGVCGKRIADKMHKGTAIAGIAILLTLFLIVTIRDIIGLF